MISRFPTGFDELSHDVPRSEFRDRCLVFRKQLIYPHPGPLLFYKNWDYIDNVLENRSANLE